MQSNYELRAITDFTFDKDEKKIRGYAIVYNSKSLDLGGFTETIRPGAVTRCLTAGSDVRALLEHDPKQLLGRTSSRTLELHEDQRGLRFTITPPNTNAGRDAVELLSRGDIRGASFRFTVPKGGEAWSKGQDGSKLRELRDINIDEISLVSQPAYPLTEAALRSLGDWEKEQYDHSNKIKLIDLWGFE